MDNLTGYVKLINHIENNREHVYNVYVENYDNQIFEINIAYTEYGKIGGARDLNVKITEIFPENLALNGQYYVPAYEEDVEINVDNFKNNFENGNVNIGSIMSINKNFVMAFDNKIHDIQNSRVESILKLNKSNFMELISEIHEMNIESIDIDQSDLLKQFMDVKDIGPEESIIISPRAEKYRIDNYGNKLNQFGNFADYDVR